jgi:hypothetical protein
MIAIGLPILAQIRSRRERRRRRSSSKTLRESPGAIDLADESQK